MRIFLKYDLLKCFGEYLNTLGTHDCLQRILTRHTSISNQFMVVIFCQNEVLKNDIIIKVNWDALQSRDLGSPILLGYIYVWDG